MKSRLILFAVVGPAASLAILFLLTGSVSYAQSGTSARVLGAMGRSLQHLASPGFLVLYLLLCLPAAGAGALAGFMEKRPGRALVTRLAWGAAALTLISPASLALAYFVDSSAPLALFVGLAANGWALALCWGLAHARAWLTQRPQALARYLIFAVLGPICAFAGWIAVVYAWGMIGAGVTPVDAVRRYANWMTVLAEPLVIAGIVASSLPAAVAARVSARLEDRQFVRLARAVTAILLISPWTMCFAIVLYWSNWLAFCFTFAGSAVSFAVCSWLSRLADRRAVQPSAEVFA